MWHGTMFVDLDWPLNASSLLSASAELLVHCLLLLFIFAFTKCSRNTPSLTVSISYNSPYVYWPRHRNLDLDLHRDFDLTNRRCSPAWLRQGITRLGRTVSEIAVWGLGVSIIYPFPLFRNIPGLNCFFIVDLSHLWLLILAFVQKNRSAQFSGRMSLKATKPGSVSPVY